MSELASDFVRTTGSSIYLTGKAGTGKTTFLKTVVPGSGKKYIILAPTGVAAINAGGVTIHSMFGLPTKSFIPENQAVDPNIANNPAMLMRHFHFNREKINLLNELELLVIDEVSMVRADIMDAIDLALKSARRDSRPFGGVQVLFIGDLFQLSPVVKDDERALLSQYYQGFYFFHSRVYQNLNPVIIELDTIYRQQDQQFVRILNNIRNAEYDYDDHEDLLKHYKPDFEPDSPGYITLTTHNAKADQINERELQKIEGRELHYEALVSRDFPENMYPTDKVLRLKKGAQVMFIKNDTSGERLYFNGKIGTVKDIVDDKILVFCHDEAETIEVGRETWENKRYKATAEKIEEETLGSFSQYPLRLAWAITIHKSQGLTFDKAIIDAGASFAPGQVYVALSRCRSMDGLILKSEIMPRSIRLDQQVIDFSSNKPKRAELLDRLYEEQQKYARIRLMNVFSFDRMIQKMTSWYNECREHTTGIYTEMSLVAEECKASLIRLEDTAYKFRNELNRLIPDDMDNQELKSKLKERITRAADYFSKILNDEVLESLDNLLLVLKNKSRTKRHLHTTEEIINMVWHGIDNMYQLTLHGEKLYTGSADVKRKTEQSENTKIRTAKPAKGESALRTLELLREGFPISEIAEMRGFSLSTIETHLAEMISQGKIDISELLDAEKIRLIDSAIAAAADSSITSVKLLLDDSFSYGMIRWVINARKTVKMMEA